MAPSAKAVTGQSDTSTTIAEALVTKLKELNMRIQMLRDTKRVSSETASLLDALVNSAYLNAANLKTSLQPVSNSFSSAPETQEVEEKPPEKTEGPNCWRCGREVKEGYKLCPYCGYDLKPKACDSCGQEILTEFRFCPTCGKRFG